jgi:hypothetical protein
VRQELHFLLKTGDRHHVHRLFQQRGVFPLLAAELRGLLSSGAAGGADHRFCGPRLFRPVMERSNSCARIAGHSHAVHDQTAASVLFVGAPALVDRAHRGKDFGGFLIPEDRESHVIPAKAGIHRTWVPAYARTTTRVVFNHSGGPAQIERVRFGGFMVPGEGRASLGASLLGD